MSDLYEEFLSSNNPFVFEEYLQDYFKDQQILCHTIGTFQTKNYLLIGTNKGKIYVIDTKMQEIAYASLSNQKINQIITDSSFVSPDFLVYDETQIYQIEYQSTHGEQLQIGTKAHYIFYHYNQHLNFSQILILHNNQVSTLKQKKILQQIKQLTLSKEQIEYSMILQKCESKEQVKQMLKTHQHIAYVNSNDQLYIYDIYQQVQLKFMLPIKENNQYYNFLQKPCKISSCNDCFLNIIHSSYKSLLIVTWHNYCFIINYKQIILNNLLNQDVTNKYEHAINMQLRVNCSVPDDTAIIVRVIKLQQGEIIYSACLFYKELIMIMSNVGLKLFTHQNQQIMQISLDYKNENDQQFQYGMYMQIFGKRLIKYFDCLLSNQSKDIQTLEPMPSLILFFNNQILTGFPLMKLEVGLLLFEQLTQIGELDISNIIENCKIKINKNKLFHINNQVDSQELTENKQKLTQQDSLSLINHIDYFLQNYFNKYNDIQIIVIYKHLVVLLLHQNQCEQAVIIVTRVIQCIDKYNENCKNQLKTDRQFALHDFLKQIIPYFAQKSYISGILQFIPDYQIDGQNNYNLPKQVYYQIIDNLLLTDYQNLFFVIKKWKLLIFGPNQKFYQKLIERIQQQLSIAQQQNNTSDEQINVKYLKQSLVYLFNQSNNHENALTYLFEFYSQTEIIEYCIQHKLYGQLLDRVVSNQIEKQLVSTDLLIQITEQNNYNYQILSLILQHFTKNNVQNDNINTLSQPFEKINTIQQDQTLILQKVIIKLLQYYNISINSLEHLPQNLINLHDKNKLTEQFLLQLKPIYHYINQLVFKQLYNHENLNKFITQNRNVVLTLFYLFDNQLFQDALLVLFLNIQFQVNKLQYTDYDELFFYFQHNIKSEKEYHYFIKFKQTIAFKDAEEEQSEDEKAESQQVIQNIFENQFYLIYQKNLDNQYNQYLHILIVQIVIDFKQKQKQPDQQFLQQTIVNLTKQFMEIYYLDNQENSNKPLITTQILNYYQKVNIYVSSQITIQTLKPTFQYTQLAMKSVQMLDQKLRNQIPMDELIQTGVGIEMLFGLQQEYSFYITQQQVLKECLIENQHQKELNLNKGIIISDNCSICRNAINFAQDKLIVYFCGHVCHHQCQIEVQRQIGIASNHNVCCNCIDVQKKEMLIEKGMGWWMNIFE